MIEVVKNCSLFLELYEDELELLLKDCPIVHFDDGDIVIKEGDEGQDFFIIVHGRADITKDIEGKTIQIATLTKGDAFGEGVILNNKSRLTTIRAQGRCDVLAVDHKTILDLYKNSPPNICYFGHEFGPNLK